MDGTGPIQSLAPGSGHVDDDDASERTQQHENKTYC